MASAEEVLEYWFGPLSEPHDFNPDRSKLWWVGGPDVDEEIRQRFGPDVRRARAGQLDTWLAQPRSALGLVILLDQFTRNLGRGTPDAFGGDPAAFAASTTAIERGFDRELRPIERAFLYMPLMHAEDRSAAQRCVAAFERLSEEIGATCPEGYPDFLPHAKQHASIVERFGRYPHRNEILGRATTPEEARFLDEGGPNFGQQRSPTASKSTE